MCGILGVIGNVDELRFKKALDLLAHRGPDNWGYRRIDSVHLGHRRLSIIDLREISKQPMTAGNGDIVGIFNGEIYNYRELRSDLEIAGYRFRTSSDTEVLLNAYHFYGAAALSRFIGMFAFAVYDKRTKDLFIARDRLGVKPLYYTKTDKGFCFASEVKSILALDDRRREINLVSVSSYLSFRYPVQNESFFSGIDCLPPACFMRVDADGNYKITRYWSLADKLSEQSIDRGEEYYREQVKHLLQSAVRYRMISDVPVGAFLSGGVDSSAIVSEMAHMTDERVKTFTIGFDDPGSDERDFARLVADRYGTSHHEILIKASDYSETLSELIRYKDAPLGAPNEVPLYLMSRELKKYVTVVLSGEGADEIFGGYGRIFRSADDYEKRRMLGDAECRTISSDLRKRL